MALFASFITGASSARAELPLGPDRASIVVDGFPEDQRKRYKVFERACSRCHSLERPIQALLDGRTPVTNALFEEAELRAYVIKMMRKRGSGIGKEDARELIVFLNFARGLAREGQADQKKNQKGQKDQK